MKQNLSLQDSCSTNSLVDRWLEWFESLKKEIYSCQSNRLRSLTWWRCLFPKPKLHHGSVYQSQMKNEKFLFSDNLSLQSFNNDLIFSPLSLLSTQCHFNLSPANLSSKQKGEFFLSERTQLSIDRLIFFNIWMRMYNSYCLVVFQLALKRLGNDREQRGKSNENKLRLNNVCWGR